MERDNTSPMVKQKELSKTSETWAIASEKPVKKRQDTELVAPVNPWSFRHAAERLINRFRVLNQKMTSYELMYGRRYQGNICQFGESVLFKTLSPWKGDDVFHRGVWVGKSHWNDNHVVMTPNGVVEARSIRRVAEQFSNSRIKPLK